VYLKQTYLGSLIFQTSNFLLSEQWTYTRIYILVNGWMEIKCIK